VLGAFIKNVRDINVEASHYMRTRKDDDKLRVRARLAAMAGVRAGRAHHHAQHHRIARHVIAGFDWTSGDEAVMANQDYGAMLDMFKLQARRRGMTNRYVDIPMDPKSDARGRAGLRQCAVTVGALVDDSAHGEHHRSRASRCARSATWRMLAACQ